MNKALEIPLNHGKFAIVDAADYEWLNRWKWHYNSFYAVRDKHIKMIAPGKQKKKRIYMHSAILNPPEGFMCDHINRNRLDNRRENLRICTRAENQRNRKKDRDALSQYRGVHKAGDCNRWIANITKDGVLYYLGIHKLEIDAAKAYDKAAIELHGEFASLNFIEHLKRSAE